MLQRSISVDHFRRHPELDNRCVWSVLDKSGMNWARAMGTPGSKEAASPAATGGKDETITSTSEHHLSQYNERDSV